LHCFALQLHGKRVIITGGSSGIGLEIARRLARLGAHVALLAREVQKLKDATEEVTALAKNPNQIVTYHSVDVADHKATEVAITKAASELGGIDVVIASAGVTFPAHFENTPLEKFSWMMNINYLGCVHTVRAALPFLKKTKEARIVLLGSMVCVMNTAMVAGGRTTVCTHQQLLPTSALASLPL